MGKEAACVLLAEDDRFLRKAAEVELRRHKYRVLIAVDGEEAVRLCRQEKPDLVLLDLIMPKMQGFEALRILKEDPATSGIPVIVLSNLGQDEDMNRARQDGAAAYLIKANLSLRDLVNEVTAVLQRNRR